MSDGNSITVVVVNRNNRDRLRECLFSLRRQSYPQFHVIVVDNASIDESVEMIEHEFETFAYLIRCLRDRGYCGAVNQAIRASKSNYVALLRSDTEVYPTWLEELTRSMERANDIGMCASKILCAGEERRMVSAGLTLCLDGHPRGRGAGEIDRGQFEVEEEILLPDTGAALFRRVVFEKMGLFDEDFFGFGEDVEMGLRARLGGWRAFYSPRAVAYRHHFQPGLLPNPAILFYLERNRIWLVTKLFPLSLLPLNPFLSGLRWTRTLAACILHRKRYGLAEQCSAPRAAWTAMTATLSGVAKLPRILWKRREIHRRIRIVPKEVRRLLRRYCAPLLKPSW